MVLEDLRGLVAIEKGPVAEQLVAVPLSLACNERLVIKVLGQRWVKRDSKESVRADALGIPVGQPGDRHASPVPRSS